MITITNEDNMELMSRYPDKYFDFCLTDPPYGVNLKYNSYDDTLENWYNLMNKFIPEIIRVCKMSIFPSCSINKMDWIYKNHKPDWLISWNKGSTGHAAYIGFNSWEPLLVYGKIKKLYLHDAFTVSPIQSMGDYGHPCPKPIKYYSHFFSKIPKGSKIIEPFLGSGTAAIAAHNYNLDLIGCELDKEYYEKALDRLNKHQMQQSLF
jgi:site-specific DNA-methyltransferase (adenine-specific)